jgi:3-methyladenine DNA glycosylase AlkC
MPSPDDLDSTKLRLRKPAIRQRDIPKEVRSALNQGLIPTKNLVEWLATDRPRLLQHVLEGWQWTDLLAECRRALKELEKPSALRQSFAIGRTLARHIRHQDPRFASLTQHPSDIVREWSAVMVGAWTDMPFKKRLPWIKPMADDENAGLRELAWMAMRHHLANDLGTAIADLIPWTGSRSERLRRFASEVTRPCGVWCAHLPQLKQDPAPGLLVLEPLRADTAKYVRDSVANWLNDASKSQPDWVRAVADRWRRDSPCAETEAILNRALRTLQKGKG